MAVTIIDEIERVGGDAMPVNLSSDEAGLATALDEVFERHEHCNRCSTDNLSHSAEGIRTDCP
jgi:hypothetical protein